MPVQFLSDEQARRYGQFHAAPSSEQLRRFFEFGPDERADIDRHRSDRARLCAWRSIIPESQAP